MVDVSIFHKKSDVFITTRANSKVSKPESLSNMMQLLGSGVLCYPLTKIHPQPRLPQPQFEMHAAPTGAERCICRTIFVFMAAAAEEILLIKLFYELRSQGEKRQREEEEELCGYRSAML